MCKEMYDQHTAIFAPGLSVFHKKKPGKTPTILWNIYIFLVKIFFGQNTWLLLNDYQWRMMHPHLQGFGTMLNNQTLNLWFIHFTFFLDSLHIHFITYKIKPQCWDSTLLKILHSLRKRTCICVNLNNCSVKKVKKLESWSWDLIGCSACSPVIVLANLPHCD